MGAELHDGAKANKGLKLFLIYRPKRFGVKETSGIKELGEALLGSAWSLLPLLGMRSDLVKFFAMRLQVMDQSEGLRPRHLLNLMSPSFYIIPRFLNLVLSTAKIRLFNNGLSTPSIRAVRPRCFDW